MIACLTVGMCFFSACQYFFITALIMLMPGTLLLSADKLPDFFVAAVLLAVDMFSLLTGQLAIFVITVSIMLVFVSPTD